MSESVERVLKHEKRLEALERESGATSWLCVMFCLLVVWNVVFFFIVAGVMHDARDQLAHVESSVANLYPTKQPVGRERQLTTFGEVMVCFAIVGIVTCIDILISLVRGKGLFISFVLPSWVDKPTTEAHQPVDTKPQADKNDSE